MRGKSLTCRHRPPLHFAVLDRRASETNLSGKSQTYRLSAWQNHLLSSLRLRESQNRKPGTSFCHYCGSAETWSAVQDSSQECSCPARQRFLACYTELCGCGRRRNFVATQISAGPFVVSWLVRESDAAQQRLKTRIVVQDLQRWIEFDEAELIAFVDCFSERSKCLILVAQLRIETGQVIRRRFHLRLLFSYSRQERRPSAAGETLSD